MKPAPKTNPDMALATPTHARALRGAAGVLLWLAVAVLSLGAAAVPARAQSSGGQPGGIGGTGITSGPGGIGGTGIASGPGGIGGTGIARSGMPITGYGPIQAFGSVFVNGREYAIDGRTLVVIDGAPATVSSLRVGEIAEVQGVVTTARGGYAREIAVTHPIIGQLSDVAADGRSATVLGQHILAAHGQALFAGLGAGALVAVSALPRPSGDWVAQRVTALPPGNRFQLAAEITSLAPGRLAVAGTIIQAPPSLTAGLAPGERVIVSGTISPHGLLAAAAAAAPVALGAPGTLVEVRGYFQTGANGQLVTADGLAASGAPAGLNLNGQHLVEIQGELTASDSISIELIDTEMLDPEDLISAPAPAPEAGSAATSPPEEAPATDAPNPAASEPDGTVETRPEQNLPEVETPEIETPDLETPEIETPSKD
jgi:hypothetical protein